MMNVTDGSASAIAAKTGAILLQPSSAGPFLIVFLATPPANVADCGGSAGTIGKGLTGRESLPLSYLAHAAGIAESMMKKTPHLLNATQLAKNSLNDSVYFFQLRNSRKITAPSSEGIGNRVKTAKNRLTIPKNKRKWFGKTNV